MPSDRSVLWSKRIIAPLGDAWHHLPVNGRKQYGGMGTDQLKELKRVQKENERLRKAVSDLTLDKMILTEAARGNF